MRGKTLISIASMLLVFVIGSVATQGDAEDTYDERISDLETRVATLETQMETSTQEAQSSQQNNVTTSSSQSSTSSTSSSQGESNVYSASFSANGDRAIAFVVKNAGVYHLTAHVSSPFSAQVETKDGEAIPNFRVESSEAGTLTISNHLEAGNYVLRVTASSQWNVTITSLDT